MEVVEVIANSPAREAADSLALSALMVQQEKVWSNFTKTDWLILPVVKATAALESKWINPLLLRLQRSEELMMLERSGMGHHLPLSVLRLQRSNMQIKGGVLGRGSWTVVTRQDNFQGLRLFARHVPSNSTGVGREEGSFWASLYFLSQKLQMAFTYKALGTKPAAQIGKREVW